jgi:23S rRNA (cytosine1962-C5)-methyltransferase
MLEYEVVSLKKGKNQSVARRHPWIFSGAFKDIEGVEDGAPVFVEDSKGNIVATGHYSMGGSIAVRVLAFKQVELNNSFWEQKLKNAIDTRKALNLPNNETNCYRLIHGEGDGLPGLIIDIYGTGAVIQCHAPGMYRAVDDIAEALKSVFPELNSIYNKSKDTLHGYEVEDEYLFQNNKELKEEIKEHGVLYDIDWVTGQKTGFFLDQRINRKLLGDFSKGKKVLNTFSYSGGFSLMALQEGASQVDSVDVSKSAIELCDKNVKLNGFSKNHKSYVADVMDFMKDLPEAYDAIVLDPPAFAKRKNHKHRAVQAYKRLNALAIKQIQKGGIIFTFSCSQAIDLTLFKNTIVAAGIEVGREVRVLHTLHQPADHPISLYHPEGEYLKGLVIKVD